MRHIVRVTTALARLFRIAIYAWLLTRICLAGTITFSGTITQSVLDGTGPALNNPGLNNILDSDPYIVTIEFAGSITAPSLVPYDLTGASLSFQDSAHPAIETAFDSISLTVSAAGLFDQVSLLACLTSGGGCSFGNQLTANLQVPAAMLNSQNLQATGLDQPHPLDLLEDDGTTDIHGTILSWTNTALVDAPEPSSVLLLICVLAAEVTRQLNLRGKQKR